MQNKNKYDVAVGAMQLVQSIAEKPNNDMTHTDAIQALKDIMIVLTDPTVLSVNSSNVEQAKLSPAPARAISQVPAQPAPAAETTEIAPAVAPIEEVATKSEAKPERQKKTRTKKAKAEVVEVAPQPAITTLDFTSRDVIKSAQKELQNYVAPTRAEIEAKVEAGEIVLPKRGKGRLPKNWHETLPEVLEKKFTGRINREPFMDAEAAIEHDRIYSLIDGTPHKSLTRYHRENYNIEHNEYIAWFNLRADYPSGCQAMVDRKRNSMLKHMSANSPKQETKKSTAKTVVRSRKIRAVA